MIEITYSREQDTLKDLPHDVQKVIQGILQVLDKEYGASRNKYEDNGGYVIKEVAFFIGKNESYVSIWNEVYSLISKIKNDEDVENFFVEFLINDEGLRTDITKIVDDYFRNQ